MTARRFVQELPAQRDHLRQIQVVPLHHPVVHPVEPGIQPAADAHHGAVGVCGQKGLRAAVELAHAHDGKEHVVGRKLDPGKVIVDPAQDLRRPTVLDQRVGPLALDRPAIERNEKGLRDAAQFDAHLHACFSAAPAAPVRQNRKSHRSSPRPSVLVRFQAMPGRSPYSRSSIVHRWAVNSGAP